MTKFSVSHRLSRAHLVQVIGKLLGQLSHNNQSNPTRQANNHLHVIVHSLWVLICATAYGKVVNGCWELLEIGRLVSELCKKIPLLYHCSVLTCMMSIVEAQGPWKEHRTCGTSWWKANSILLKIACCYGRPHFPKLRIICCCCCSFKVPGWWNIMQRQRSQLSQQSTAIINVQVWVLARTSPALSCMALLTMERVSWNEDFHTKMTIAALITVDKNHTNFSLQ